MDWIQRKFCGINTSIPLPCKTTKQHNYLIKGIRLNKFIYHTDALVEFKISGTKATKTLSATELSQCNITREFNHDDAKIIHIIATMIDAIKFKSSKDEINHIEHFINTVNYKIKKKR